MESPPLKQYETTKCIHKFFVCERSDQFATHCKHLQQIWIIARRSRSHQKARDFPRNSNTGQFCELIWNTSKTKHIWLRVEYSQNEATRVPPIQLTWTIKEETVARSIVKHFRQDVLVDLIWPSSKWSFLVLFLFTVGYAEETAQAAQVQQMFC